MAIKECRTEPTVLATRSRATPEQIAELCVLQGEVSAAISGAIVRLMTAAWEARARDARGQAERLIGALAEAADAVRGCVS